MKCPEIIMYVAASFENKGYESCVLKAKFRREMSEYKQTIRKLLQGMEFDGERYARQVRDASSPRLEILLPSVFGVNYAIREMAAHQLFNLAAE